MSIAVQLFSWLCLAVSLLSFGFFECKKFSSLSHFQFAITFLQSQEKQVLKQLAEKREREKEVLTKAQEVNNNYSKMTEEKLNHKLELIQENRMAHLNAVKQRLGRKSECI